MEERKKSGSWRWANLMVSALFILFIWLPIGDSLFGLDPMPDFKGTADYRVPECKLSREDIAEYPEKFEAFYNSTFGFRNSLIRLQNLFKVFVMHAQRSGKIIIGKKGWFFLNADDSLESYRGTLPLFTSEELNRWCRMFQARHDYLASLGIRYLVIFVPNKNTVYPEYMPDALNRVEGERRLDQLVAYLGKHAKFDFVDIRQALISSKSLAPTYQKLNSHWTHFGSYVVYKTLMDRIANWFPEAHPLMPRDLLKSKKTESETELPRMIGLSGLLPEELSCYVPKKRHSRKIENSRALRDHDWGITRDPETYLSPNENLPDMMIVGDSFSAKLMPYLRETFRKSIYIWHHFSHAIIEAEKPDLVINEIAERFVQPILPENPENVLDIYLPFKSKEPLAR